MKTIYDQLASFENQKDHPFGFAEKRFEWKKMYNNGNDLKKHKRNLNRSKDNLEGGIGRFISRNERENEKEGKTDFNLFKNYNQYAGRNKNRYIKYLNLNSQRVIQPEKDNEIKKINKKRTYHSQEKNLLHTTGGRITTLFNKTPLKIQNKTKKMFYDSVDYGRRKDTNYFAEEFLNDKNYNRIPGVDRKHLIPRAHIESQSSSLCDPGRRRHYLCYKNRVVFG